MSRVKFEVEGRSNVVGGSVFVVGASASSLSSRQQEIHESIYRKEEEEEELHIHLSSRLNRQHASYQRNLHYWHPCHTDAPDRNSQHNSH